MTIKQCRICLETYNSYTNSLINSCSCKGSMQFIHINCLRKCILLYGRKCGICLNYYNIPQNKLKNILNSFKTFISKCVSKYVPKNIIQIFKIGGILTTSILFNGFLFRKSFAVTSIIKSCLINTGIFGISLIPKNIYELYKSNDDYDIIFTICNMIFMWIWIANILCEPIYHNIHPVYLFFGLSNFIFMMLVILLS